MPIIDDVFKSSNEDLTKVLPENYKGSIVDSDYVGPSTIATFVEGKPVVVNYYSVQIGSSSGLTSQEVGLPAPYQCYNLIKNLEIRVIGDQIFEYNLNTDNGTSTGRGSANIYPVFIPNAGDMLTIDIGDGREGLFTVYEMPIKKSIRRGSIHTIAYELVGFLTPEKKRDLDSKVHTTFVFDIQSMRMGKPSLISLSSAILNDELSSLSKLMVDEYLADFFSHETYTIAVPDQDEYTYDPFVARFLMRILSSDDTRLLYKIRRPNVYIRSVDRERTIWNVLELADINRLRNVSRKVGLVPTRLFRSDPMFSTIAFSRFKLVARSKDELTNVDAGILKEDTDPSGYLCFKPSKPKYKTLDRAVDITDISLLGETTEDDNGPLYIKDVLCDDYYVFSEAFYRDNGKLSLLEGQVLAMLRRQRLDVDVIYELTKRSQTWNNLERFYYVPVVLALIKMIPRSY